MLEELQAKILERFPSQCSDPQICFGELSVNVESAAIHEVCAGLRDDFGFEQLIDICGVDYLTYGEAEWDTESASGEGFSRGVEPVTSGRFSFSDLSEEGEESAIRFGVIYHLLSVSRNLRLRLKVHCGDKQLPRLDSVVDVWSAANWFEREAFDMFGIIFDGHPDLRRILTDYGFVGHPFRKDFPQIGQVEMQYDPEQRRVVYQPVSIEPRVLVPKVVRDHEGTEVAGCAPEGFNPDELVIEKSGGSNA